MSMALTDQDKLEIKMIVESMALTDQDKLEIKMIVQSCLCEHYEFYGMSANDHSKDHAFIKEWKTSTGLVKKAGIWTVVATVVTGALGLFLMGYTKMFGGG